MPYANSKEIENNPNLNQTLFGFDEDGKEIRVSISSLIELINSGIVIDLGIYSYQLPYVGLDIEEIVEKKYYTDEITEASALSGFSVTYENIAKTSFIVKGLHREPYDIMDNLGNIITPIFDYYYISGTSYYVTKENVAPSTVYFKFIEK